MARKPKKPIKNIKSLCVIRRSNIGPIIRTQKPCKAIPCNTTDVTCKLRTILAKLQSKPCVPSGINSEEIKYTNSNYNGSFHKTLEHDVFTGELLDTANYEAMVNSIINNNQTALANIPLSIYSELQLLNPTGSAIISLVGAPNCALNIDNSSSLSSAATAAEMLELYAMAIVRDIQFNTYDLNMDIQQILDNTRLNNPSILTNLKYKIPTFFESTNIFRGWSNGDQIGPYLSQLLLADIPYKNLTTQQYLTTNTRYNRVEWGVDNMETINIANGYISGLPVAAALVGPYYINTGRSLAEFGHSDINIIPYINASMILEDLGCQYNPSFVKYLNQKSYVSGPSSSNIQTLLGQVANLAMQQAWYSKWKKFRRLRPETMGLWIDNVQNARVTNATYQIDSMIFGNNLIYDVQNINATYGSTNSFTLPLCYKEGSPASPSYPSIHATVAGACCTLLKIFYDCANPWSTLPGVLNGKLTNGITTAVETDGINLLSVPDILMIDNEINKLASNIGMARCWAGVNFRSDVIQGILLGEQVAIKFMQDILSSWPEDNLDGTVVEITFRSYLDKIIVVRPTIAK